MEKSIEAKYGAFVFVTLACHHLPTPSHLTFYDGKPIWARGPGITAWDASKAGGQPFDFQVMPDGVHVTGTPGRLTVEGFPDVFARPIDIVNDFPQTGQGSAFERFRRPPRHWAPQPVSQITVRLDLWNRSTGSVMMSDSDFPKLWLGYDIRMTE